MYMQELFGTCWWHPANHSLCLSLQIVSTRTCQWSHCLENLLEIFLGLVSGRLCSQWFKSQLANLDLALKVANSFFLVLPQVRAGPVCGCWVELVTHFWAPCHIYHNCTTENSFKLFLYLKELENACLWPEFVITELYGLGSGRVGVFL